MYINEREFNIINTFEKFKEIHVIDEGNDYMSIIFPYYVEEDEDKYTLCTIYGIYKKSKNNVAFVKDSVIHIYKDTLSEDTLNQIKSIYENAKTKKVEIYCDNKEKIKLDAIMSIIKDTITKNFENL